MLYLNFSAWSYSILIHDNCTPFQAKASGRTSAEFREMGNEIGVSC
jgi:hypothetical protein